MKNYKKQSPAQRKAIIRNQHKGRVAMTKGLFFWMLRDPQRSSLTSTERALIGDCILKLERILKQWQKAL